MPPALFSLHSRAQRTTKVHLALSLAAAALDGLFKHPADHKLRSSEVCAALLKDVKRFVNRLAGSLRLTVNGLLPFSWRDLVPRLACLFLGGAGELVKEELGLT